MGVWADRPYLLAEEDQADLVRFADQVIKFRDSLGYTWFTRVIRARMSALESRMRNPITSTSTTSADEKVTKHNAAVTEYRTLQGILQMAQDAIERTEEELKKPRGGSK